MLLSELLEGLPETQAAGHVKDIEITGMTDDSRTAGPGMLFVALQGEHADGHDHIGEAIKRGAVAVITEKRLTRESVFQIVTTDSVEAMARMSARFFGYPSQKMTLIGLTGTNGKTTSSLLVQSILRESGKETGLIGTLRYEIGEETLSALNTTPNALHLQSLLGRMVDKGMAACVMEVSSHALALGRVRECCFDARVFTNLTRDHLDFHRSMEDYYEAKRSLFQKEFAKPGTVSVINRDDPWGARLARECSGPVLTFGLGEGADFRAVDPESSIQGLVIRIKTPRGDIRVTSSLIGMYNVYNILSAVAVGTALKIPEAVIVRGIAGVTHIPGRFEKIDGPGFTVVVDYAHTDEALKSLLHNSRQLCDGSLITLFGCGGDRDRGKRPLMGKIAAELSDRVIVTSDNPRTEAPGKIIDDILSGIDEKGRAQVEVIPDRRQAILTGIAEARKGDMVVVAGKGHEDYQILGEKRIHFDDREEVRSALQLRTENKP